MFCGAGRNASILTTFYYVPLTDERAEEVESNRISEHTDYGSFTFILNDDIGGLEVNKNTFHFRIKSFEKLLNFRLK